MTDDTEGYYFRRDDPEVDVTIKISKDRVLEAARALLFIVDHLYLQVHGEEYVAALKAAPDDGLTAYKTYNEKRTKFLLFRDN